MTILPGNLYRALPPEALIDKRWRKGRENTKLINDGQCLDRLLLCQI